MSDTTPVAAGEPNFAIDDFRKVHAEALHDKSHAEHGRRVDELTKFYEGKFGAPEVEAPEPSLDDLVSTPLAPDAYEVGPNSHFGLNVGQHEGWDGETESQARLWMSNAGFSQAGALSLAHAYAETQGRGFDAARGLAASIDLLDRGYAGRTEVAVAAIQRVISEAGGEELKTWLNDTGLGNHPKLIREVLTIAERKGYLRRGA